MEFLFLSKNLENKKIIYLSISKYFSTHLIKKPAKMYFFSIKVEI